MITHALRTRLLWLAISGALLACRSGDTAERIDVVLRDRIPLGEFGGSSAGVMVRRGESTGVLMVAAEGGSRVLLIRPDRSRAEVSLPDTQILVSNLGVSGNSLWIADAGAQRVVTRTGEGPWHETFVPTIQANEVPTVVGVLADSEVVVTTPVEDGRRTKQILVALVRRNVAKVVDSISQSEGEMRVESPDGGTTILLRQPWAYRDLSVIGGGGHTLTLLRQRRPTRAHESGPLVVVEDVSTAGRVVAQESLHFHQPARVDIATHKWVRAIMTDSLVQFLGGRTRTEAILLASVVQPSQLPAIRRAVRASRTALLLERITSDPRRSAWEIWQRGRRTGAFELAPGILLQDATDSTIWATTRKGPDEIDILVYSIRRR